MRKRPVSLILGDKGKTRPRGHSQHSARTLAQKKALLKQVDRVVHKRARLKKRRAIEQHKKRYKKQLAHHQAKKFNWAKLFMWLIIIAGAIFLWKHFDIPARMLQILQINPTIYHFYETMLDFIQNLTSGSSRPSLFYASLLSTCILTNPIFPIPPELIFLTYLARGMYVIQIIVIMMVGSLISMTINWLIGRLIGERLIKSAMKKSYPKFRRKLEHAGGFIVLIGNIIPFPMEIFAVFLGAVKYNYKKYILFTLIGRLIKFVLLAIGFVYFLKYAAPYLDTFSIDWFIQSVTKIFVFW
ncbi:DedA family protein [Candidatus Woesearchaeota archaeon]|nr:DedA family protein [Candidatus Woesearchaeota archaeon]